VVIQEWWGLVTHIKNIADRFAKAGYLSLAPDLYHGESAGNQEPDEAARLLMEMRIDQAAKDMAGAVDALLALPETTGDGVGVVGFCAGGGNCWNLALGATDLNAAVIYYGTPVPAVDQLDALARKENASLDELLVLDPLPPPDLKMLFPHVRRI